MPDASVGIGVVVVAYRSASTIEACLRSILADPGVVSVVVQDNSFDGDTADTVARLADSRVLYVADDNVGFAAGCNRGVERLGADVEWVAFVNPDVELERPLSELVSLSAPRAATVVGARVDSPRAPGVLSARRSVTLRREMLKAAVGPRVYALRTADVVTSEGGVAHVDQVSGALMLLRRSDFESLGGFDERFELYYEDVDLCARAGGCAFVTERWGRHVGGASSATASGAAYAAGRVSRMRYLRKHRPGVVTEAGLVAMTALEAVARAVGRGVEGAAGRRAGVRAQLAERSHPGSVSVLERVSGRGRP